MKGNLFKLSLQSYFNYELPEFASVESQYPAGNPDSTESKEKDYSKQQHAYYLPSAKAQLSWLLLDN